MVDRIRYPTVSYLPFYYVFFQFLLLTIFNLKANILTTKDILSNLGHLLRLIDLRVMPKKVQDLLAQDAMSSNLLMRPIFKGFSVRENEYKVYKGNC